MSVYLLIPIAMLYLLTVGALFLYGVNFFHLTYLAWRSEKHSRPAPKIKDWPKVTVQLPIYNERYVAERLIRAAAALEYPRDRIEIQVLDDSTDDTKKIIQRIVECIQMQHIQITHIHRTERHGFKAGALASGTKIANGDFLVIFDADFIPQPDFLIQTIPYFFLKDDSDTRPIAFLQTRWGHINSDYSLLTRLQSLAIDAHFMVEQYARSSKGYVFNFNGTAGIWRREAIDAAGGWKADTLTEDLDLSYRAYLKGWRAVYLKDVVVRAELPVSFSAYRKQQHRWARGSLECAIKLTPDVWRSNLPLSNKIGATLHLTGYGVHLLLFVSTLLYPVVIMVFQEYPQLASLFNLAFIFNLTAFAPTIFFVIAQKQLGNQWWQKLPIILLITSLGAGMMINTVQAALQIASNKSIQFERTPKFGISQRKQEWKQSYYQLKLDPLVFIEMSLAAFNLLTAIFGFIIGNWVVSIYALLFGGGLMFVASMTILQSISIHRNQMRLQTKL